MGRFLGVPASLLMTISPEVREALRRQLVEWLTHNGCTPVGDVPGLDRLG